jgi:uncharacterized protein (TIGR00369 family)
MGDALFRSKGCFVCGTENPHGLDLQPEVDGEKVFVRFVPRPEHRGFSSAIHGGIVAALLDEVLGVATGRKTDAKCATAELTVTYRRPVRVGEEVRAEGWYVRRQGEMVIGKGQVIDLEGKVLATARGRFLPLDQARLNRFIVPGQPV